MSYFIKSYVEGIGVQMIKRKDGLEKRLLVYNDKLLYIKKF